VDRETEIGSRFKASLGKKEKKIVKPVSKNKPSVVVHICNPSYLGG
jgi:hypothetical protein